MLNTCYDVHQKESRNHAETYQEEGNHHLVVAHGISIPNRAPLFTRHI